MGVLNKKNLQRECNKSWIKLLDYIYNNNNLPKKEIEIDRIIKVNKFPKNAILFDYFLKKTLIYFILFLFYKKK